MVILADFEYRQSSRLKPSLTAWLATSIAQAGHENFSAALETLDLALENCDQAERNFVDVIKVRMHLRDSICCSA